MWSREDASSAQGHPRAGWTSVSLALEPSNKRKADKGEEAATRKNVKQSVFGVIEDQDGDQGRARAQAQRLVCEGSDAAVSGDSKTALAKFDQALFFDPENAKCHEMKAQMLNSSGRTWDAVQAATTATKLRPEWSEAWVTLAQCQGNLGEPELALASLAKAREAASDPSILLAESGQWEQLSAARKSDQSAQPTRVNVVDADKSD